ncbi:MAG TPA: glutamate 5-kinase [Candidatus Omnitrophota bacterium]|nr:glutamate 5-kinase [Candidatus Omnitrophota bacterium]HPB68147.1 glutamate 5-kinase [Candidatus Omnitrophota bacterium]HQO57095.1 glutamate 5-kinase [Candidatus Omnitrophota bacterium]
MFRKFPRPIKRIVIKIGSSNIASYRMKPRTALLKSLVSQIALLHQRGIEVILVSSGAIVLGMGEQELRARPGDVASLQALAAIGQLVLMRTYADLFKPRKITCAQVLLTWDDFSDRMRFNNARATLKTILERKVIPVINENDTISTQEIKFGDNDKLSALVASQMHADLLIILSDVEGLYDPKSGRKKVFREIKEVTAQIEGLATGTPNKHMSKGGMSAKLQAVQVATQANVPCIIANARTKDVLPRILAAERIGTLFVEKENRLLSRKHWISFGAKPKGVIFIDAGAEKALLQGGRSLLLPGVLKIEGHFKAREVVVVRGKDDQEIARGISNYSTAELNKALLQASENRRGQKEAIHCDNLVLSQR